MILGKISKDMKESLSIIFKKNNLKFLFKKIYKIFKN